MKIQQIKIWRQALTLLILGLTALPASAQRQLEVKVHDRAAPISRRKTNIDIGKVPGNFTIDPSVLNAGSNFKMANFSAFENTSVVIAPGKNQACPNGKIVLSTGEPERTIFTRDLNSLNGGAPQKSATPPAVTDGWLGTDNILVKGKDGATIYLLRNGVTWASVASKPKWWSNYKIAGNPNGSRVVTFVMKSSNCGASFENVGKIDPLNFDNGKFAVPRPILDAFGGWDRLEAYVDPFNGNMFVTVNAAAGVADANGKTKTQLDGNKKTTDQQVYNHFLFKSSDNGKTWQKIHEYGAWTPIVITTTPNGRIYLYSLMGETPMIAYSTLASGNTKFTEFKKVNYKLFNLADIEGGVNGVYGCAMYKPTNSISRVSIDTNSSKIRISYPIVNGYNHTGVAIAGVEVSDTGAPVTTPLALVYGQDMTKQSIMSSQFIEPDADIAAKSNKAAFYWVEAEATSKNPEITTGADGKEKLDCFAFSGKASANYVIINSEKPMGILKGKFLSKTGSGDRFFNVANMNDRGRYFGDYAYGGSYFANGRSYFLGQWREDDGVQANIISVKP